MLHVVPDANSAGQLPTLPFAGLVDESQEFGVQSMVVPMKPVAVHVYVSSAPEYPVPQDAVQVPPVKEA